MSWRHRSKAVGAILGLSLGLVGLLVWCLRDPNPPARLLIPDPGRDSMLGVTLGFALDDRTYAVNGTQGTTTWDLLTGRATVRPIEVAVFARQFSPDGQHFAGWSVADQAVVWGDTATAQVREKFPVVCSTDTHLPSLTWTSDGSQIQLVTFDPTHVPADLVVFTWDTTTGVGTQRLVLGPQPTFRRPRAYAPDGRTWVYRDGPQGDFQRWDSVTDRPIGKLLPAPTTGQTLTVVILAANALNRAGPTLLLSTGDGRIEFRDLAAGRSIRSIAAFPYDCWVHENPRLSPDGRLLALTAQRIDPTDWLGWTWNLIRRKLTGKLLSEDSSQVVILDLATGQPLANFSRAGFGEWSHTGRLFSTYGLDGTISIRDTPPTAPP